MKILFISGISVSSTIFCLLKSSLTSSTTRFAFYLVHSTEAWHFIQPLYYTERGITQQMPMLLESANQICGEQT